LQNQRMKWISYNFQFSFIAGKQVELSKENNIKNKRRLSNRKWKGNSDIIAFDVQNYKYHKRIVLHLYINLKMLLNQQVSPLLQSLHEPHAVDEVWEQIVCIS